MPGSIGSGGNHQPAKGTQTATALTRWPACSRTFSEDERAAWKRLGRLCLAAGTIAASDLLAVEMAARVLARVEKLFAAPEVKITSLTAYLKLLDSQLRALGLSPVARRAVAPLPTNDFDRDDPIAEFHGGR